MHSAEIKIKGFPDPVRAENIGDLQLRWQEYKIGRRQNELVTVAGWNGTLSDILSFRKIATTRAQSKAADEAHNEYMRERAIALLETPEVRAKRMGFFRIIYWGFTGKRSEDVTVRGKSIEQMAETIQRKFFTEHPKRIICDPALYKPIIKSEVCHIKVMDLIERQIKQDKFSEAKL